MIVQVHFSGTEINQFFESNGFEIVDGEFGRWEKAYHNRDEWNGYTADAVQIDNRYVKATDLFAAVSEHRLKQLITGITPDDVQTSVKTCFNQLLNSI
ncbi:hypothetical protein [Maribellus mangrovi]|uniref:hypothetical protein n=1 Tax=Maribellus mangrovi TaxID=3133146 RepID=UPI0030EC8D9B